MSISILSHIGKSDPVRQWVIKSGIAVTNWVDSTQVVSIRNLYVGMSWEEFSEELSLKLGPRFFKLYLLHDDDSRMHEKLTEGNYAEVLKMAIAACKNISKPSTFRLVFFYPPKNETDISPTTKPAL